MTRCLRRGFRRGFSLVEAVVVVVLMALLSSAAVVWFSATSDPASDTAARTSLHTFVDLQHQGYLEGAGALSLAELGARDYARTYVAAPSGAPNEVSVALADPLASAAVATGSGTCWYVRVNLKPGTAAGPPVAWYVSATAPDCDAADVTSMPVPDAGTSGDGVNPDKPITVP